MKQNKIKIIFVDQTKIIEKPKSLNKFKEKVSNIFNLNFDVLTDVIINIKSPIDELIENNDNYNDYILYNNSNNIVIEIIDLYYPIKKLKINEINQDYSCNFYEDNETLKIKLADLRKDSNKIKYIFKIQNNGKKPWPEDTFLKCVKEDSDIFFFHCKTGPVKSINNNDYIEIYNEFEIIINFKNTYPNIGDYQCHAILMSDSKGQMGKSVGTLNIKIY